MALLQDFDDGAAGIAAAVRPAAENTIVFERLDSTQACALRLIDQAEAEEIILPPTLIVAGSQHRGRGRGTRTWQSPPGGLYLSWVVAELEPTIVARLPMIAAAAAVVTAIRLGIDEVGIKWPNDLVVAGRKLAGILVNARHGATTWVAVGFGINLEAAPAITGEITAKPTSVAEHQAESGPRSWAEVAAGSFVGALAEGVASPDEKLELWRQRLIHRPGDLMSVRLGNGDELRGRFSGLTDEGHLRLEVDGEERVVSSGDVVE